MEEFYINNEQDYIKVTFEKVHGFPGHTSYKGGYDVQTKLEINCGAFSVVSGAWLYTGGICSFYQQLTRCHKTLSGIAEYIDQYENYLSFRLEYTHQGHIKVNGRFSNNGTNELIFEFRTDQTFIDQLLRQLKAISDKYDK